MLLYVLIFFAVALLVFIDCYLEDNKEADRFRFVSSIVMIVFLCLVSGTRLLGGSDYYLYQSAYEAVPTLQKALTSIQPINSGIYVKAFDKGYLYITAFFKTCGFSFHLFCLFHALFFYFCLYFGLRKYCKNFSIVLLVFISKIFFYNTFISMRQSITIAIFFLSLDLIRKRKLIPYMMLCLLCLTIHAGSALMIPIYFIANINMTKKRFAVTILILMPFAIMNILHIPYLSGIMSVMGGVLGSSALGLKLTTYTSVADGLSPIYYLEFLIIAFFVYTNFDALKQCNPKQNFVLCLFLLNWVVFSLLGSYSIATREKDYFTVAYAFLLSDVIGLKDRKVRFALMAGVIAICGFEFFRYILVFDNGGLIDYSSWLFNFLFRF